MRARSALVAGLVVTLTAGSVATRQVFRASSDLVLLSVSVVTGQNRPVGGLELKNFKVFEDGKPQDVAFFSPPRLPLSLSILLDASSSMENKMAVAREETFGPVAPLFRFKTEAEAIALANDTEFGLAAYFYGRDISRVWRVAETLESGIVGINTGLISTEVAPFGGVKESGLGREGSHHGMEEYVEIKYVMMAGV